MLRRKLIHSDQLASMGKMAANLAHEIHNPMSVIKIYVDFLEQGISHPDKRREAYAAIRNNITRINRIIESILSFARQEKPRKEWTDIRIVLQNTLEMTTHFKRFSNVKVEMEHDESLPPVLADQHRLTQVFVNLLNNARDAIGETAGRLNISCRCQDGDVVIAFRDTGRGIKSQDLPNLFTPFFTTKAPGQGTGLGLSISYGIIQDHGGSIEVESREGHGATFTIRLPLTAPEPGRAEERQKENRE